MINYYLITKPGIMLGNLITMAAGFLLASKGNIDLSLFLITLIGLGGIIASACVFNNYIDRDIDKKMARTKNRPLVTGRISKGHALFFATLLLLLGNALLFAFTNLLTLALADAGFFIYVVLYSFWKCHTLYGTAIGSIAGAIPPVVGYTAVSNHLDAGALILFTIMVLWQMPHFFSIAIYRMDDYIAAELPLLPIRRGLLRTKIHMVAYIAGFILAATLLTYFGYTGILYLAATVLFGLIWLGLCISGFKQMDNKQFNRVWGRNMLRCSLVVIFAFCLMIPFDLIK
jgi:protoheme IX farnesyltransferase